MELRLNQLESQIRALTGQIEQFDFGLRQMRDRMQALASDMDFRFTALEKGGVRNETAPGDARAEAGDGGPVDREGAPDSASQAAAGSGVLPSGSPKTQYDYAKNLLRRANYQEAEQALLAFVAAYPDGALTGNALYWLGETYYVRGEFKLAAIRFAEGYKRFPDHPKGPDNLLKLGMSLGKLDKNREACTSLSQIDRQYPNATSVIRRTAAVQRKRFNCR
jgi:tol-pal system protein YbgF